MRQLVIIAMLGFLLTGSTLATEAEKIIIGESFQLSSDVLDEERTLLVSLPENYETSTERYPVLYLLDARSNFHHTTGTLRTLSRVGRLPEMIVISLVNTDRTRDLTPSPFTPDPDDEDGAPANMASAGGADNLLDFFQQELFPHVEKTYRTVPYRVLIGHSFGGLFAVHALVNRPQSFNAYVAISPSLWWEDGELVDQAEELFNSGKSLGPRTLFMSLADEGGDMYAQYRRFEELLRYAAPEGLTWEAMMMEGDDHGSVTLRSTYHGLQTVYPRWRMPNFAEGFGAMQAHYEDLSQRYGYEIPLPEGTVNQMGYRLLGQEKFDEAIQAFQFNTEHYPESANVYDSLGDGFDAAGKHEEAFKSYGRACELAEKTEHPNLEVYCGNRDRLREKLQEP